MLSLLWALDELVLALALVITLQIFSYEAGGTGMPGHIQKPQNALLVFRRQKGTFLRALLRYCTLLLDVTYSITFYFWILDPV